MKFITICPGGTLTPIIEYSSSKSTFPEYRSLFKDFYDNISYQSAGKFSQRFIEILEMAENGTVWMVESGELKKIECPVMWMGKHF